jgi:hypothetical protein
MQEQECGPRFPSQAEQPIKGDDYFCILGGIAKAEDPADGVNNDQYGLVFQDPPTEEVFFHWPGCNEERIARLQPQRTKVAGYVSRSVLERHEQHGSLPDTPAEERPPLRHGHRQGPGEGALP